MVLPSARLPMGGKQPAVLVQLCCAEVRGREKRSSIGRTRRSVSGCCGECAAAGAVWPDEEEEEETLEEKVEVENEVSVVACR